MATIPTLLYYFGLFLMVELDVRKIGVREVPSKRREGIWAMVKERGFHFTSLFAIVAFMIYGFSPIISVFWAILLAAALSWVRKDTALTFLPTRHTPLHRTRLAKALEAGAIGVVSVAVTCAAAGIIVGVVTLTGLGLKFSSIVIHLAGGSLLMTAVLTSLVVWIVGLAVPVTASYIICAVIAAPALTKLGVPAFAAHMFVFYYAVLSEVSPPTALSPFAAAAITGGDPYKTTLQTWKYTLPAFLVPFAFVLDPAGVGLLLKGSVVDVIHVTLTAALGIAALACGTQGWMFTRTSLPERLMLVAAGLLLVYPATWADLAGAALVAIPVVMQRLRLRAMVPA
jgi:TRAP transporter 4TM/12TM fusion protein